MSSHPCIDSSPATVVALAELWGLRGFSSCSDACAALAACRQAALLSEETPNLQGGAAAEAALCALMSSGAATASTATAAIHKVCPASCDACEHGSGARLPRGAAAAQQDGEKCPRPLWHAPGP